jgi:hypothetical protein
MLESNQDVGTSTEEIRGECVGYSRNEGVMYVR